MLSSEFNSYFCTPNTSINTKFYLYGVNTSFTVTTQNAPFVPVESIAFTVPKDGMVGLKTKNVALLAKVNPTSATYKTGTWTSSDLTVAEISANGVLTPKAYGKTTITFTSGEVAYRQANEMPANNETLVKSFDIYVVGDSLE
ncbi:Ig-like domain-containing protein [Viscerimonas tarda]